MSRSQEQYEKHGFHLDYNSMTVNYDWRLISNNINNYFLHEHSSNLDFHHSILEQEQRSGSNSQMKRLKLPPMTASHTASRNKR